MKPNLTQDTVLNTVVLVTAWLIVIAACVDADVEAPSTVIRIAYAAL